MHEIAYAKINLALHVRERLSDGYHSIETLFAFAEDGDVLGVSDAEQLTLQVEGPFAASLGYAEDNLVLRAADALRARYGVKQGAALTLDKHLPVAAGIGGGSADAAAALRLLVRWWDISTPEDDLLEIARRLGADVAACLRSTVVRGEGRGDTLAYQDQSGLSGTPLLLVNPGVALSTADVFKSWNGDDRGALPTQSHLADALGARNDLEEPAQSLVPQIADVLAALKGEEDLILARMSGSGATCFALFETEGGRDRTAVTLQREHPDWWQLSTRLR